MRKWRNCDDLPFSCFFFCRYWMRYDNNYCDENYSDVLTFSILKNRYYNKWCLQIYSVSFMTSYHHREVQILSLLDSKPMQRITWSVMNTTVFNVNHYIWMFRDVKRNLFSFTLIWILPISGVPVHHDEIFFRHNERLTPLMCYA